LRRWQRSPETPIGVSRNAISKFLDTPERCEEAASKTLKLLTSGMYLLGSSGLYSTGLHPVMLFSRLYQAVDPQLKCRIWKVPRGTRRPLASPHSRGHRNPLTNSSTQTHSVDLQCRPAGAPIEQPSKKTHALSRPALSLGLRPGVSPQGH
jgi:hypothetical protein